MSTKGKVKVKVIEDIRTRVGEYKEVELDQVFTIIIRGKDKFACEKIVNCDVLPYYDYDGHFGIGDQHQEQMERTRDAKLEEMYKVVRQHWPTAKDIFALDSSGFSEKFNKEKGEVYGWSHSFNFVVRGAGKYECGADVKFVPEFDPKVYKQKGREQNIRLPFVSKGPFCNTPVIHGRIDKRYKYPAVRQVSADGTVRWIVCRTRQEWEATGHKLEDLLISNTSGETILLPRESDPMGDHTKESTENPRHSKDKKGRPSSTTTPITARKEPSKNRSDVTFIDDPVLFQELLFLIDPKKQDRRYPTEDNDEYRKSSDKGRLDFYVPFIGACQEVGYPLQLVDQWCKGSKYYDHDKLVNDWICDTRKGPDTLADRLNGPGYRILIKHMKADASKEKSQHWLERFDKLRATKKVPDEMHANSDADEEEKEEKEKAKEEKKRKKNKQESNSDSDSNSSDSDSDSDHQAKRRKKRKKEREKTAKEKEQQKAKEKKAKEKREQEKKAAAVAEEKKWQSELSKIRWDLHDPYDFCNFLEDYHKRQIRNKKGKRKLLEQLARVVAVVGIGAGAAIVYKTYTKATSFVISKMSQPSPNDPVFYYHNDDKDKTVEISFRKFVHENMLMVPTFKEFTVQVDPNKVEPWEFNLYRPFIAGLLPLEEKADPKLIEDIKAGLLLGICNRNTDMLEYIILWLASLIRGIRPPTALCCYSEKQRTGGKSVFFSEFLMDLVFGQGVAGIIVNASLAVKDIFNGQERGKQYILFEEMPDDATKHKPFWASMKNAIVGQWLPIREMHKEVYNVPNIGGRIMSGNKRTSFYLEPGNKRFVLIRTNPDLEYGDLTPWRDTLLKDPRSAKHFATYLYREVDIANSKFKNLTEFPITEEAAISMESSLPSQVRFLQECRAGMHKEFNKLIRTTSGKINWIMTSDVCELYSSKHKQECTPGQFSAAVSAYWKCKNFRINTTEQHRGYELAWDLIPKTRDDYGEQVKDDADALEDATPVQSTYMDASEDDKLLSAEQEKQEQGMGPKKRKRHDRDEDCDSPIAKKIQKGHMEKALRELNETRKLVKKLTDENDELKRQLNRSERTTRKQVEQRRAMMIIQKPPAKLKKTNIKQPPKIKNTSKRSLHKMSDSDSEDSD